MYFPYLRGKQFELLAIKEYAAQVGSESRISPVIEPVRDPRSNGAFARTVGELVSNSLSCTLLVNPAVGVMADPGFDAASCLIEVLEASDLLSPLVSLGVLASGASALDAARTISMSGLSSAPVNLLFEASTPNREVIRELGQTVPTGLCFSEDKAIVRRYREDLHTNGLVRFKDHFPYQATNLDYVDTPDSVFTDDHLYYAEDGYAGFGDYTTIGSRFSEGGSSPRAVVIHFTYEDPESHYISLRHFCSDSNDDTSDTAGKFAEAVAKLVAFVDARGLGNPAVDAFRVYHESGRYPGLGMLKKLSILNHFYLVDGLLRRAA